MVAEIFHKEVENKVYSLRSEIINAIIENSTSEPSYKEFLLNDYQKLKKIINENDVILDDLRSRPWPNHPHYCIVVNHYEIKQVITRQAILLDIYNQMNWEFLKRIEMRLETASFDKLYLFKNELQKLQINNILTWLPTR